MSSAWTPFEAFTELLVALGTFALAWKTKSLANETKDLATKAGEQVEAGIREAKATESLALEARTDRLLAWRPQLELKAFHFDRLGWYVDLRNSGSGTALTVMFCARDHNDVNVWTRVPVGDLRPGEAFNIRGQTWPHGMAITSIFEGFLDGDQRRTVDQVMMCTDVLGRRFRFGIAVPITPYPGEITRALSVEISVPEAETQARPQWATEPLIWG